MTDRMQTADQLHRFEFRAMASNCEIVVAAENRGDLVAATEASISEVLRLEQKYSRYQANSHLSQINRSAGSDWIECDAETQALLDYADALYQSSAGLFDITSGVLRRAWDFKNPVLPSQKVLDELLLLVGWEKVQRKDNRIFLPILGMELDFGGFGKEYAADRAAAILEGHGIRNGYVNLGGDLRVIGPKPDNSPWQLGIQHPRKQGALIASIPVQQGALATSGDYERYFELDGQRYCHVLSPKTGYPVRYWQSVSVVAPLSVTAGSYTTIAMLKEADGLKWLQSSGVSFLAVDAQGMLHQSATV